MTTRRISSRAFPAFRLAPAAMLFAAALALASGDAGAASATGSASVTIRLPAGVIGLQQLSNANGFLAPSATGPGAIVDPAAPRPTGAGPLAPAGSGGLTAAVSISGAPNQTFSLTLTDSLVVVTDTGELVVTNFSHSAGDSPTIGGDGSAEIGIGATTQPGSADNLQQLSTQAGDEGAPPEAEAVEDDGILEVVVQTEDGPRVIQVARPDPFGPTIFGEKFFTVLVSYN